MRTRYATTQSAECPEEQFYSGPIRMGSYELLRVIGRGGMAIVHEAIHLGIERSVALKTLSSRAIKDPELVRRFFREARVTSRIHHTNIVDVIDIDLHDGRPFIVMELLDGESLEARLRRGPLSLPATLEIVMPLVNALDHAHRLNVVHRDLKPGNVFLARSDRFGGFVPKLLDFGIAKIFDPSVTKLTRADTILGTLEYLSPEQIRDSSAVGPRSDQYSLAVVIYQCLTGYSPFRDEDLHRTLMRILNGVLPPMRQFAPHLPNALERVIARAMHGNPAARFESMRHFGEALLGCAASPSADLGCTTARLPSSLVRRDVELTPLANTTEVIGTAELSRRAYYPLSRFRSPPLWMIAAALIALLATAITGLGLSAWFARDEILTVPPIAIPRDTVRASW